MGRGKRPTKASSYASAGVFGQLTGDAALDRLLARFAARPQIAVLTDPQKADGRCQEVAQDLVDYLRLLGGFDQPGREAYISGDEWVDGEMVRDYSSPDDLGYGDRSRPGQNSHIVCFVDLGEETLAIDFTAAQYGYEAFPLVQRLTRGDSQAEDVWELSGESPNLRARAGGTSAKEPT